VQRNIYVGGEYVERNPLYHVEDSPWKARQILKLVEKHGLRFRSVCEIGCGAGEILRQLQLKLPRDVTFHGYDISPQAIALCRQRENETLRFFCEDLLAKDTPPFDLLLCIDVFEHVEDYLGFLRRLRGKATHKVFHVPLDMTVQALLRRRPFTVWRTELGHLHYFMKDTALSTLEDTGYEIVDYFYTAGAIDQPETVKQHLAKIPRQILARIDADFTARTLGGYALLVLAK
jgi:cyclopropane fatty-acyl-phospholipid synthase-like methyltransferase